MTFAARLLTLLVIGFVLCEASLTRCHAQESDPEPIDQPDAPAAEPVAPTSTADDDEPTPEETGVGRIGKRLISPQDLLQQIHEGTGERDGLFERGPVSLLHPSWVKMTDDLEERTGVRMGFSYTFLHQYAGDAIGRQGASGGDFDFFARWKAFTTERGDVGQLGVHAQQRHSFTEITPSELGESIGSIWDTTRAFNEFGFRVDELWWDQQLAGDRISLRIGTLNPKNMFDQHRQKGQNFFFLSTPFSDSPTIAFPKRGLGLVARLSPSEAFHFTLGLSDANGTNQALNGASLFQEREFFTALDIIYVPVADDDSGSGRYGVTLWHTDERTEKGLPSGRGFSAVIEQEITPDIVPFLRYGYGEGADLEIEHMISGGVGFSNPFKQNNDTLGVGAAWARPTDGSLRDQYGGEAYYRVQLTPVLSVTPGVQLIVNPSRNPEEDVIALFEIRARIDF